VSASKELITLAYEEPPMLSANPFLRRLQDEGPIIKVRTLPGDEAWLVTGHDAIRQLTSDRRIGRTHPDPVNAPKYVDNPALNLSMENYDEEPEMHSLQRMLLASHFSRRKMEALRPKLVPLINDAVARLAAQHGPVDVHTEFSMPLTAQVLGEALGIPPEGRANLPALTHQTAGVADLQSAESGLASLTDYMASVAALRRADPGDDILSSVVQTGCTDLQAGYIGVIVLFAAMASTAANTTLGIATIANDPALRDRLIADPDLMKTALDELLRMATINGLIFPHYAREDIEIGDVTIGAGDLVLIAYGLANFDKCVFPAAEEVDITRSPNPHVSFGYGMWHCTGAPLARMHLTLTFSALLAALPTIRLAKPLEEQGRTSDFLGGGLDELLVTW
jgi:cytochrome P450 monooxygenase